MEKKEPIKVSMSTFFLILAIIVIAVMGYFMFKLYNEKSIAEEKSNELNAKVSSLENVISNVQNTISTTTETNVKEPSKSNIAQQENQKLYSYKDIKGFYGFKRKIQDDVEEYYYLYLYENGTFKYQYGTMSVSSIIGNYIIEDNKLILNKIFVGGGDVGLRTSSGEMELTINPDGTITDSYISSLVIYNQNSKVTLKRTSEKEEQEYLQDSPTIMNHINSSVENNAVSKGE